MKKRLEILNIISRCQKEFEVNLKNKEIMFICEDKTRKTEIEEVIFPKSCFYHLTGIIAYDKSGQELNSYRFYELLSNGRINENNINRKNNTTDLKLQVLPQLMKIDKISNMMGEFEGNNIYLQTQKVAGTINACMGFVKNNKNNRYIPNTVLQKDIREIASNRKKIVAILKKDMNEDLYKNITYLKQNYEICNILNNTEIVKKIDTKNIYSSDKIIDSKICRFLKDFELRVEDSFSEYIFRDLLEEKYSGNELLEEFKKRKSKIRYAIKEMIKEADAIAKENI